jgi:hypothetical protein
MKSQDKIIEETLKDNGLKNKSKIVIEIDTNFNKFTEKDFDEEGDEETDLTEDVELDFHRAVYDWIERQITENDELEQDILEDMGTYDNWLPKKAKDFSDLGAVSIRIYKE